MRICCYVCKKDLTLGKKRMIAKSMVGGKEVALCDKHSVVIEIRKKDRKEVFDEDPTREVFEECCNA